MAVAAAVAEIDMAEAVVIETGILCHLIFMVNMTMLRLYRCGDGRAI